METYASASMDSISYFSRANTVVFPALCNAAGYTDVDAYCNSGASEICCGLCPNTSVAGIGQFAWAIISYAIGAFCYTLSPEAVWGLAILQAVNANCFIAAGMIRVWTSASKGGMTLWHTQFLWPQALGFIFIMAPATFAPQWSRLGENHVSMTKRISEYENAEQSHSRYATREDVRKIELGLWKPVHRYWNVAILVLWWVCLSVWTGMYVWVCLADPQYWSQYNCQDVISYTLSPTVSTCILGGFAWLLLILDVVAYIKKKGISDLIIDHLPKGKKRHFDDHRKLERMITIGFTLFLFILWLFLNCWMWIEGMQTFLLTGADIMTFGQVEQFTALFPDLLGLFAGISAYLASRAELHETRRGLTSGVSIRSGMRPSSTFQPRASVRDTFRSTNWSMMDREGHARNAASPVPSESSQLSSSEEKPPSRRAPHVSTFLRTPSSEAASSNSGDVLHPFRSSAPTHSSRCGAPDESHHSAAFDPQGNHQPPLPEPTSFLHMTPSTTTRHSSISSHHPSTSGSTSAFTPEHEYDGEEQDGRSLHGHYTTDPVPRAAPQLRPLSAVSSFAPNLNDVGREGTVEKSLGRRKSERGESRRRRRKSRRDGGEL